MKTVLKEAIELRAAGKQEESNQLLTVLAQQFPEHPQINYQCAWSFDLLGEEEKAVPYYEKAIQLGLEKEDLEGALLGLGSTYRTLGEYEKSRSTFAKGIELFPSNQALKVFLAMTLYNLAEHQQAMDILLKCLAETSADKNISAYKKAIGFYADKLDETWN
ncbi:tetratricopeptide repeat protein [Planococcus alpniumensis]|uniref:tetratricopeptide repeat protein n=1 Tax=Planococcus alpniumensis TaxID=2708345 RepID=UPI001B8BB7F1|nr:tetratricopeptide repeat protein [Planococcus sp. MSAK28401]